MSMNVRSNGSCLYDGWGNLTNTVYSDGTPSIVRTYDALGRLASVTDVKGTAVYAYDAYGSVTNEATTGVYTKSLTRHRDAYGRDIGHSVDGVRANTITYDSANGRIVGTQIGTTDFQWSYLHGTDLKSQLTCGAVGVTSWSYEQHRDLLTQVQNRVNGTVVSQYDYTSDALARRTQIAKSGSAMAVNRTDTYGYNVRNELISAAHDGINEYTYVYDDIGNRLSSYELGTNRDYTANCLNQYEAITSDAQTTDYPRFDLDGNQTNVTTRTGTWSIIYNGENRPILWTSGPTNLTMRYDFMGRRVEYVECVGAVTNKHQRFVYDDYLCIQRLNGIENVVTDHFEWDPTEPIATRPLWWQSRAGSVTNMCYYTHDGNKNVSDLVRVVPCNESVAHYEYTPFGGITVIDGLHVNDNPFRFASEYQDSCSHLTYYNYRFSNHLTGSWTSRDPLLEMLQYGFVNNNPIAGIDYLGLKTCYKWMLITFYDLQKPKEARNSWNKADLTENDAAVGLRGWKYEKGHAKKVVKGRGRDDYAYPPLTEFVIERGRKKGRGGDRRTVRDGGSGWVFPRRGAPNGVGCDEWLDLWCPNAKGKGVEIDLVKQVVDDRCPCPEGWNDTKPNNPPENLKKIQQETSR